MCTQIATSREVLPVGQDRREPNAAGGLSQALNLCMALSSGLQSIPMLLTEFSPIKPESCVPIFDLGSTQRWCGRAASCVAILISIQCQPSLAEPPQVVSDFIKQNCLECHNASETSGSLDLTASSWEIESLQGRTRWIRIHDRVSNGEMPPDSKLTRAERQPFTTALGGSIAAKVATEQAREGRTILRRLNRREFENSLKDLLGVDIRIQHLLPEDGRAHGFDTVAEGLHLSAVQMERYLEVIDFALDACVRLTERPAQINKRFRLHDERDVRENLDIAEGHEDPVSGAKHRQLFRETADAIIYVSNGYSPDNIRQFAPAADGRYRIRISAYSVDAVESPVAVRVFSSDWKSHQLLGYFELASEPRVVELTVPLTTSEHLRINGYGIGVDETGKTVWNVDSVKNWKVPGMAVQWIEIEGPLLEQWPPQSVASVFGTAAIRKLENKGRWTDQGHIGYEIAPSDPKAAAVDAISQFSARAFRRPLKPGEAARFISLAQAELDRGRSYEQAVRVAVRGILVSPRFLMLDESPGRLDNFAVASRLSFLFWSSPPDDELLRLADEGKLSDRNVLHDQVERMLTSPRSHQFVASFAGQWLDLNQIDATAPDMKLYPEYDELLRSSMVAETEAFFREMLTNNLPIDTVIDSDFAMLDRRMAEHYELMPSFNGTKTANSKVIYGEEFRRVALPADNVRGGVMTQAAVLKVTANGTVTSPVTRGSWILRRIIGKPPSPPPPVAALEPDTRGATTIREQLAKHRDSETCHRCHREIDPPGFALESFDVIGGFRKRYRSIGEGDRETRKLHGRDIWEYKLGPPVDCSGQTSGGLRFADINDFKRLMLADKDQVARCLVEKLIIYSTGAPVSFSDRAEVDRIVAKVVSEGGGLRTLVHEVAASEVFLTK